MNDIFSYILQNISYSGHVTNVQIKLNSLKVKQKRFWIVNNYAKISQIGYVFVL